MAARALWPRAAYINGFTEVRAWVQGAKWSILSVKALTPSYGPDGIHFPHRLRGSAFDTLKVISPGCE
jgi:hypothetical protein